MYFEKMFGVVNFDTECPVQRNSQNNQDNVCWVACTTQLVQAAKKCCLQQVETPREKDVWMIFQQPNLDLSCANHAPHWFLTGVVRYPLVI